MRIPILITLRRLLKNPLSSVVQILGLALGLACFAVILIYVERESGFDRFHKGHDRIYRVVKDFVNSNGAVPDATTPPALATAISNELAAAETATRLFPNRGRIFLLEAGEKRGYEMKVIRIDTRFFDVFDFPFVSQAGGVPLPDIHSMILTETSAKKYFGSKDPLGQIVKVNLNGGTEYKVTAIVRDVPENSHFTFDILIPFESTRNPDTNWDFSSFYTYVKLKEGADPGRFESAVKALVKQHQPQNLDAYYMQALKDIHLYSNLRWELSQNGSGQYLRILVTIALFVLLLAGINYVNLVTAQSAKRAREVGVRKVSGAGWSLLVRQFLSESLLTSVIALAAAVVIVSLTLPLLTPLVGYDLSAFASQSNALRYGVPASAVIIGLLAGIYPAFYFSSVDPVTALKGSILRSHERIGLRKALVTFQFVISTALIFGTLIIYKQLDFMQSKDFGFEASHVMLMPNVRAMGKEGKDPEVMLQQMRSLPGVINIGRGDGVLGVNNSVNGVTNPDNNSRTVLNFTRIDYDFVPAMKIRMLEGRNFSDEFQSDSTAIILNETAAKEMGLSRPWVGRKLSWDDAGMAREVTVVGIVADFHFTSLREMIKPFGFVLEVGNGSVFVAKLDAHVLPETVEAMAKIWTTHDPQKPFTYTFQDDHLAQLFVFESRFQKLFSIFTFMAIFIACLGLFGLMAKTAEARVKEIGIRKVLGASIHSILILLGQELAVVALIGLAVATPAAYVLMNQWLNNFAYRTSIDWWTIVLSSLISIVVAVCTISLLSFRAATANPVTSLRTE